MEKMENFLNSVATDWENKLQSNFGDGGQQQSYPSHAANAGQPGQMNNMAESNLPVNRNVNFGGRRLQIEKLLGEGGFAFVYQVVDMNSGQRFALKKIMTQNKSQEII
jgi:hypothetical protein